jgi:hypothetical protein
MFLSIMGGCAAAAVSGKFIYDALRVGAKFPIRMLGPSMNLGHMIRDGKISKAGTKPESAKTRVTIVGGGIAGLSAGWWLHRNGFSDFKILELEREVGGNSSFGQNEISAYPWGAHYVPLANQESDYVRILFQELGVIQGFNIDGLAIYNDLYMCHDPEERLFKDGSFQEGLVPQRGLQPSDKQEFKRFFETMKNYREMSGRDGKPAFAIPLNLSSQDEQLIALDQISMADWMKRNDFLGRPIRWYIDYCCRDDYGALPEHVSAWAGIHYFAGRKGVAANAEMNSVVTWPAGNGFLSNKLREILQGTIKTETAVFSVADSKSGVTVSYLDVKEDTIKAIESEFVILAAPRFLAQHLVLRSPAESSETKSGDYSTSNPSLHRNAVNGADGPQYAPWMVANISLKRVPEGRGVGLAWDNVSYSSRSLGYVVATHQNITTQRNPSTVITYYYPMAHDEPSVARRVLLNRSPEEWSRLILADLEKMHNGITEEVTAMELWPWGHGMIRPSVGFIWGEARRRMKERVGNIYFAHSDMSGISNFEEAQYQGVEAAKQILARVKS